MLQQEKLPPEELLDVYPLSDAMDQEILMHRDAHFGGEFSVMLEYYHKGGKGVHSGFELSRIEQLQQWEKEAGENLAPHLLSGVDAETIGRSRDLYKKLRALYETEKVTELYPRLIADLILSEEEEAEEEVQAVVREKNKIIPFLMDIIRSDDFHDPLFPGYGHAPFLAAKCLGLIGDSRSIVLLFDEIGQGDFDNEKMVLRALKTLGEPAKNFLLKVLRSKPLTEANVRAALALIEFKEDLEVGEAALQLLEEGAVLQDVTLATYLILLCEGLQGDSLRDRFKKLQLPKALLLDYQAILKTW